MGFRVENKKFSRKGCFGSFFIFTFFYWDLEFPFSDSKASQRHLFFFRSVLHMNLNPFPSFHLPRSHHSSFTLLFSITLNDVTLNDLRKTIEIFFGSFIYLHTYLQDEHESAKSNFL